MIKLLVETSRNKEILDKFQQVYVNLKKIVDKQNKNIQGLEDQIEEYKKKHLPEVHR